MLALVIVVGACVVLLGVLVTGLLRSHADILRALHSLGAGVGDPSEELPAGAEAPAAGGAGPVPLTIGPPLPRERSASSAPDLGGVTPDGDAVAVAVGAGRDDTLLAFLSSGCSTCQSFWEALAGSAGVPLPPGLRLVVVTKGPDQESPAAVRALLSRSVQVVMSTAAWRDYEVPGSPFFALVDGESGRRVGEGIANSMGQVLDLVGHSRRDRGTRDRVTARTGPGAAPAALDGPERERDNDRRLQAAGIGPGHPSLYPRRLDDVFGSSGPGHGHGHGHGGAGH